jgi:hypothetical protein
LTVIVTAPVPRTAHAEPLKHGALTLEWHSPPNCPRAAAVLDRVKSLLAASPSPNSVEALRARGRVIQSESGSWQLSLETLQGERRFHRSVSANSCDEVTEAGALIVALTVDPDLTATSTRAGPPPGNEEPPPAAHPIEAEAATPPVTARSELADGFLCFDGVCQIGGCI